MILCAVMFQFMFWFRLWVPWFFETLGWLIVTIASIILLAAQLFIDKAKEEAGKPQLVTWGLYSYSRNPMYLTFMVSMIGFGMGTGLVWFIVLGFASGPIFNDFVIPHEEAHLEGLFGRAYGTYKKKTPRWL